MAQCQTSLDEGSLLRTQAQKILRGADTPAPCFQPGSLRLVHVTLSRRRLDLTVQPEERLVGAVHGRKDMSLLTYTQPTPICDRVAQWSRKRGVRYNRVARADRVFGLRDRGVGGSNPLAPTKYPAGRPEKSGLFAVRMVSSSLAAHSAPPEKPGS